MLNWFKRKTSALSNWDFEDVSDFSIVQNSDSVQYVSPDEKRIIYFSILEVSGGKVFSLDSFMKPTIIESPDGWQLKGAKKSSNRILTCVISLSEERDIEWAQTFFDSIVPR